MPRRLWEAHVGSELGRRHSLDVSNRMAAELHGSPHEANERDPVANSDMGQSATGSC
jgi:hypothetical protein